MSPKNDFFYLEIEKNRSGGANDLSGVAAGHADHAAARRFPFTEKLIEHFLSTTIKESSKMSYEMWDKLLKILNNLKLKNPLKMVAFMIEYYNKK